MRRKNSVAAGLSPNRGSVSDGAEPVIFDTRWAGHHGIGRFATEVRLRMTSEPVELHGAHPASLRGMIESELLPHCMTGSERDTTYFSPGYTPCVSWRGRTVFTIHDLIHLAIPDEGSRTIRAYYNQVVRRTALRETTQIATVSEFSKGQILDWLDLDESRVTVVGNGVDEAFSPDGPAMNLDRPYILHVGNTRPHKNLPLLLKAVARIPDVAFVLSSAPDPTLTSLASSLGISSRVKFLSGIDEAALPAWYRGAAVVAIPSLYEGFGLPALEGMACGVPVMVSETTALGEITGNGAVHADPTDLDSVHDALLRALTDGGLRNRLRTTGPLRAAMFNWDSVASRVQGMLEIGTGRQGPRAIRQPPDLETSRPDRPVVVLAHDYLTQRGGAERVVSCLADAFPRSPIVTSLHNPDDTFPEFDGRAVVASPLNLSWLMRHRFRLGLPLYGWIFEHARLPRDTDVVVASSTGFAHGVGTPPGTRKIVYCHSPARFLYLMDDYLGGPWWHSPQGWALKTLRPALVAWDQRAAATADRYLCNSSVVRERIRRVYGIDAVVINPPHSLDPTGPQEPVPGLTGGRDANGNARFFLAVSRLMPYKNVHVLLRAFAELSDEHLVVVGRGPQRDELHAAAPANVTFLEGIPDAQLRWLYAHAAAVLAPSREDYGLTPVEGFSFGTPALALRAGGYLDTVVDGVCGYFFDEATPQSVMAAVRRLVSHPLDRRAILAQAERFSPDAFAARVRSEVDDLLSDERRGR